MLSAITVGVWAMIFMTALTRGMVDQMVSDGISVIPGHVQIHDPAFLDDPSTTRDRYVRVFRSDQDGCAVDFPPRHYRVGFRAADMEEGAVVGIIDEWDMLQAVLEDTECFDEPVEKYMTANPEFIDYRSSLHDLMEVIKRDHVPIVTDGERFLGVITRIDIINYLRQ